MKSASTTAKECRVLYLQCPECTESVRVASDELVAGAAMCCEHCGAEAELTREFDDATGKQHWALVDAFDEYADEYGP